LLIAIAIAIADCYCLLLILFFRDLLNISPSATRTYRFCFCSPNL